jgi:hypothetical protein
MKEKELDDIKDYFGRKNRLCVRRFILSQEKYGFTFMSKHGYSLDLYDVQERYKLGSNDEIHKITEYEKNY